jgi:hypothetical protein
VTLLATSTGNESFIDTNGNGYYDLSDQFYTAKTVLVDKKAVNCSPNSPVLSAETPANSATTPCDDLGEAYVDKDESGTRSSNEEFIDFTSTGTEGVPDSSFTLGNGIYNGALCTTEGETAKTCTKNQVTIRRDLRLIMTSERLMMRNGVLPFINTALAGANLSTSFLLADSNGHGAGHGTTLSIDAANLKDGSATLTFSGPLLGSEDPTWDGVAVVPAEGKIPHGSFNIVISTPTILGGYTTVQTITVN